MKLLLSTSAVLFPHIFVSLAFQFSSLISHKGLDGSLKFSTASLCTCHSLLTPETLHILTMADASVLPSVYVKTLGDLNFNFEAASTLRSYELPTACTILCVRFTHFVPLWKFIKLRFRRERNTRYGWMVNPFPTGSFTLQETPSLLGTLTFLITSRCTAWLTGTASPAVCVYWFVILRTKILPQCFGV